MTIDEIKEKHTSEDTRVFAQDHVHQLQQGMERELAVEMIVRILEDSHEEN